MQNRFRILAGIIVASTVVAGCGRKDTDDKGDTTKAAAAAAPAFDKGAAEKDIRAGDDAYFASVKAKNADAIADGYASDAVSMAPGMPAMHGHDAIKKGNEDFLKMAGLSMTGSTESVKFSDDGTMAYATGNYTTKYNDAKGKPVTEEGKYLEVWQRIDGRWKVIADAFNANAAPKM